MSRLNDAKVEIFKCVLELGFYKLVWSHLHIKFSRYNVDSTSYDKFEIHITLQQLSFFMFDIQRDVSTRSCNLT